MTATIIPVLAAMYLGSSFNLKLYQKGNADIFDSDSLKGNIQEIDRSFTRSQYKLVETSTQARDFLDVSGELSLRIKKGDVEIDGSGAYLRDTANRQKFVELLVRVQHETVTQTIPSHLKPTTDWMSKPEAMVGTHFVRSITYGGELVASLRFKAETSEQREKIKAAISANLQLTGTFDLNANGSFDKLREDLEGMYNVEIKVMATKPPSSPPQTVEELMKLVDDYPKEILSINQGMGKALKAELYPLSALKKDYPNYFSNSAFNSLLDDLETKYDDVRTTLVEIHPWNRNRLDEEGDDLVEELFQAARAAQSAFHLAIAVMDTSINGNLQQFEKAFAAYGVGKDNTPHKYQRWFWKLRVEITKEDIGWVKPSGSGASYIHWGSTKCPATSTDLVYSGYAVGAPANSFGNGKNFQCLPDKDPELTANKPTKQSSAYMQILMYRNIDQSGKTGPIRCASCLSNDKIDVRVFPAMTECPPEWKLEYGGYLMAESASHAGQDFMCLTKNPVDDDGELSSPSSAAKMNAVWMDCENCGEEKIVPCVVCSK